MGKELNRTAYCGEFRACDAGKTVQVYGWVQRRRPLGGLIFITLRDRTGILQLTFDENENKELFDQAYALRPEDVITAVGTVRMRSEETRNAKMDTGDVEVLVSDLTVLGKSETPPFEIVENSKANEELRLKYRYLDLRRPDLQKNILFRHRVTKITRDYFDENGFIEIETPMLIRSTPEGARDFLVPSRIHPGEFYALPQSPQLYKQLTMVAGFDRYMQIARCFRDEDLRADRQPEFTQIDLEMSFVEVEDVLRIGEGFIQRVFKESLGVDIPMPLPRMTYHEAMERYGSDKPDVRFGMEIINLTDTVRNCNFAVFNGAIAGGGSVRALRAENAVSILTRKEIDKLVEFVKGVGGKGLAWIRLTDDGVASSFAKFMTEEEMNAILEKTGAQKGDVILIVADTNNTKALSCCGSLRNHLAKKLNLKLEGYRFLWIVEFPFFEYDEESGTWLAMHHPFTSPLDECLDYLETDKGKVRAKCYDLVLNGIELASGSIRITDPTLQNRMFRLLGLSDEEAHEKFGYLTDAFRYGAPPHGGMGLGLDRLVMQMLGCESLRDVVAYPKVQNASELMTDCPAPVDAEQLKILHIATDIEE
ncbi:MAG: aspartate--tRNA ligase [Clostridia bacterium]|nr:aspartate--tRNA ligase [Clostridia bacterium]MBQ5819835.1 aspartate--tRNA ligase [Clostridia bacterium]